MRKPTLYLLPGLMTDARVWRAQMAALGDLAEIGVAELGGADTIATLATQALANAPAERFALAGLSMGGYVALEIMRQAPERVSALALLDTSARPDNELAIANRRRLIELAEHSFPAVVSELSHKLVHPAQLADAELMAVIRGMAQRVGKEAFVAQQNAMMTRIDSRPHLGAIRCPTLVLCGREDVVTPLALHEEMAAAIPGSNLVVIEECGHLAPLGQPQRVSRAMSSWLLLASHAGEASGGRADIA